MFNAPKYERFEGDANLVGPRSRQQHHEAFRVLLQELVEAIIVRVHQRRVAAG